MSTPFPFALVRAVALAAVLADAGAALPAQSASRSHHHHHHHHHRQVGSHHHRHHVGHHLHAPHRHRHFHTARFLGQVNIVPAGCMTERQVRLRLADLGYADIDILAARRSLIRAEVSRGGVNYLVDYNRCGGGLESVTRLDRR